MRSRAVTAIAWAAAGALLPLLLVGGSFGASNTDPQKFELIERGRYLATVADCTGCHTRPGSNQPFAGGRAIETPFGNIIAPNITPDRETGIGNWSDEDFDRALRKGVRSDGSRLYPAMPYTAYTKMPRDDVLAVRAYLNSVKPVRTQQPPNLLPFPLNIRAGMLAWDALYFTEGEFHFDRQQSEEWNRGAFLVQGPGHCGACHTPKTFLGGDKSREQLQGSYLQGWFAPNITNDSRRGLGGWSVDDIAMYLKTGHNRITAATGPMAEEIALSSSHMTDNDLKAIATYLKSVPGTESDSTAVAASDPTMVAGQAIYRDVCSACHGLDGRGVERLFPSLAQSSMVRSDDPTTLIRIILRGARSVATKDEPTSPGMPSFGRQLDDAKIASVVTYIRNAWGSGAPAVAANDVSKTRSDLQPRTD
jgi:mono/diheme cytochrome c family protein